MQPEHTPGPWTVEAQEKGHAITTAPCVVAFVHGRNGGSTANARLVAAAPELLEALEFIVNDAEPGEDARLTTAGYNKACAVIAKVRGE